MKTLTEQLAAISATFPSEPFKPTAFDVGVAEQLRDIAAQIETGSLRLTHFALTTDNEGGQKVEVHAE